MSVREQEPGAPRSKAGRGEGCLVRATGQVPVASIDVTVSTQDHRPLKMPSPKFSL